MRKITKHRFKIRGRLGVWFLVLLVGVIAGVSLAMSSDDTWADQVTTNKGATTADIDGVHQGTLDNFTATIPLSEIWIDESKINMTRACRDAAKWGHMEGDTFVEGSFGAAIASHNGFLMEDTTSSGGTGSAGYLGNEFLVFDLSQEDLSYSTTGYSSDTQKNNFNGEVITYKWEDAAEVIDSNGNKKKMDVYITYSDLMITLERTVYKKNNTVVDTYGQMVANKYRLGILGANMMTLGQKPASGYNTVSGDNRYAYWIDANITIRDKDGTLVEGSYYYPMVDLDVSRTDANGYPSNNFGNFYGTNRYNASYDESLHGFSEQVLLKDNFGDIYIPGENGTLGTTSIGNYTNTAYLSQIQANNDGTYLVYPANGGSGGTTGGGDQNTYYTGFVTTGDNTNGGLKLRYYGSSGAAMGGMETYMLAGSPVINYQLKSTTKTYDADGNVIGDTDGGTIQTTKNGNHSGALDDNSTLIQPTTIVTARGQTVNYTMTPQPGYRVKSVQVSNGTLDYTDGSEIGTFTTVKNADGSIKYYNYAFVAINSNNAIHVEWEPIKQDLKIKKETTEADDGTEFPFTIRFTDAQQAAYDPGGLPVNIGGTVTIGGITVTKEANGEYSFKLQKDDILELTDLPYGVTWAIVENVPTGWQLDSKTNDTGDVNDAAPDVVQSTFVNSLQRYNLAIEKKVTGDMGDINKQFSFTVNAPSMAGKTVLDGNGNSVSFDGAGNYSFSLKHGDSLSLTGIPYGTKYTVTEATSDHTATYEATQNTASLATGANTSGDTALTTAEITLQADNTVTFTNNKTGDVVSGVGHNLDPFMLLFVLLGAFGAGLVGMTTIRRIEN